MHPINKKLVNSISNFQSLKEATFSKKRKNLIKRFTEDFFRSRKIDNNQELLLF